MGLVGELLSAAASHRRRGLKEQTIRKGDMIFAAWMFAVIFIRFAANCSLAVRELSAGSRVAGLAIAEFSMLHLLVVVFITVFLVSSLSLGAMSMNRRRLGSSPAPFSSLFFAELGGLFANPMGWIVVPFLAPAVLPLFFISHPLSAVLTLLASFLASYIAGWAASTAFSLLPGARALSHFLRIAFAAVMLGLVAANFDFHWSDGAVTLLVFQRPTLLTDGGRGFLSNLRPWSPSAWIMAAGDERGRALRPLFALGVAAAALAASALLARRALSAPPRNRESAPALRAWGLPWRRRGMGRFPRTPRWKGSLGILFSHERAYLAGAAGARLALLAGIGFSLWLVFSREPTVNIAILGAAIAFIASFSYPSNVFGHDGGAVRRYALFSLDWGKLFIAKNLAYLASTAVPMALLVLATGLRTTARYAVGLAMTAAVLSALVILWGNVSSILVPQASRRVESKTADRGGVFVNQLFPIVVWAVPFLVNRSIAPFGSASYDAAMAGCLIASGAAYRFLVKRISVRFDEDVESIMERL
jgi:hypothetical protein